MPRIYLNFRSSLVGLLEELTHNIDFDEEKLGTNGYSGMHCDFGL